MFELCTIGHITLDKIQTLHAIKYMPGGTAYYFSKALKNFDIKFLLVTAVADAEQNVLVQLRNDGIEVIGLHSDNTVYFENIYGEDPNKREQNVLNTASAFSIESMPDISAKIYHLGPLLAEDFAPGFIQSLAAKGIVSLDIQGLLRYVKDKKVLYKDWKDKDSLLPFISILKTNEFELEILTGSRDMKEAVKHLSGYGINEIIITCGNDGSYIYTDGQFCKIPVFQPLQDNDTTGCGDTYMAGYLYKKSIGGSIEESGIYGSAMAALKVESFGPFQGRPADIERTIKNISH
ncbi:MAG: PfkB family carbohydrate kinase [Ferruginibacter sp.]